MDLAIMLDDPATNTAAYLRDQAQAAEEEAGRHETEARQYRELAATLQRAAEFAEGSDPDADLDVAFGLSAAETPRSAAETPADEGLGPDTPANDVHPIERGLLVHLARHGGESKAKDLYGSVDAPTSTADYWRRKLTDLGVVRRVSWGVYGLTDRGWRYMQELELEICPT